jgi:hypothetical protein
MPKLPEVLPPLVRLALFQTKQSSLSMRSELQTFRNWELSWQDLRPRLRWSRQIPFLTTLVKNHRVNLAASRHGIRGLGKLRVALSYWISRL